MGMQSGGVIAGFLDITPTSAALVFSMSNTLATIPGILAPSVTEAILYPDGDSGVTAPAANWRAVFFLAAGMNAVATVVYMTFMKAGHVAGLS